LAKILPIISQTTIVRLIIKIKVEIFKQAINKLLADGSITRDYINQNYVGRASSGVILILSQVPFYRLTENPTGLKYDI